MIEIDIKIKIISTQGWLKLKNYAILNIFSETIHFENSEGVE